ncbi:MAG TPA: hemerythrin domain-containing protein [Casimicrobiaceae bacterium]
MSNMIAAWHADHANFANLLALLETQLEVLGEGESPDYELMLDIMYYMTHYPDRMHHPFEDCVFRTMKERAIGTREMFDALIDQHTKLRESGNALFHELDDVVSGSIASREDIATSARRYVAQFRQHMEAEESEIIPLAAQSLRPEDWATFRDAVAHVDDPLFGKMQLRRYTALRQHIAAQAREGKQSVR